MDAPLSSATLRELVPLREPEPQRLAAFDQEDLTEGRRWVRRARDRQVKIYRGHAVALVPRLGWRGSGRPKNTRGRGETGVLQDASVRVSDQLSAATRVSGAPLRAQRFAQAQGDLPALVPRPWRRRTGPVAQKRTDRRADGPGWPEWYVGRYAAEPRGSRPVTSAALEEAARVNARPANSRHQSEGE